jgi:hypothetical protein
MGSGAPARPEGDPDSGGAERVGEGAARQGTAGGGARPLLRSWRAPPPLLLEWPRLAGGGASPSQVGPAVPVPAPARAQVRQVRPSPSQIRT